MEEKEQKVVIYWSTKKTISLICAILLIPVFAVFLFSFVLKTTVISPHFYKTNLKKIDAHSRLIQEGIPSLILQNSNQSNVFSNDLIIFVIQKAVNPAWVESLTNVIIDKTVALLSSRHQTAENIDINIQDANSFLTQVNNGLLVLDQLVPSCSQAQGNEASIICKNADTNLDTIKTNIDSTREKINEVNLKTINIESEISQANAFLGVIHTLIANINLYFWTSLILLLALIATIIILQVNNLPMMAKFISLPIIISSAFGLIVAFITQSFTPSNFDLVNLNLPTEMESIITDFIKTNTFGVFHWLEICSVIALGLFLVKYLVVVILEKRGFKFFGRRG